MDDIIIMLQYTIFPRIACQCKNYIHARSESRYLDTCRIKNNWNNTDVNRKILWL